MDDSFKRWLENALAHYDRVVFLYQSSEELCIELGTVLEKEKRKFLLLTDENTETPEFTCNQKKLGAEECGQLLDLYFFYSFSDRFIFLTDRKEFPWPSIANFMDTGSVTSREDLEAALK